MGYGKRSDFTKTMDQQDMPGPGQTDCHNLNTISKNSLDKSKRVQECTFFNNYDKYRNICYKGMEQSYYLTQSQGPGAYLGQDNQKISNFRSTQHFSVPKNDRGLLTMTKSKLPAPNTYKHENLYRNVTKQPPKATIGRAIRDIPFAKYGSWNKVMILKGLH